jgi:hypothetical protein
MFKAGMVTTRARSSAVLNVRIIMDIELEGCVWCISRSFHRNWLDAMEKTQKTLSLSLSVKVKLSVCSP